MSDSSVFSLNCDFRSIDVDGRKVQTYSIGHGDKLILSFPAYPHSGLMYVLFMLNFDLSKVKLVTFDLPGWIGMTESVGKEEVFNLEDILKITKEVVKEYKMEKFNVIGYSYGSLLALESAKSFSDRVERVAVVSPVIKKSKVLDFDVAFGVAALKVTGTHFLLRPYLNYRFKKYKQALLDNGVPVQFVYLYEEMMKKARTKYLLQSIHDLFFRSYGVIKWIREQTCVNCEFQRGI